MSGLRSLVLLLPLAACATPGVEPTPDVWAAPYLSGSLPAAQTPAGEPGAPDEMTLPVGVGFTTSPSTILLGASLDFPFDRKLTLGPSLQAGFDDDRTLGSLTAQLKYYIPEVLNETKAVVPYVTGGVGAAVVDKDGRSSDTGFLVNAGLGLRYLTGDRYRLGSEARVNLLPNDLADEDVYLSIELLQIVLDF
jgi:hypothetical protein